MIEDAETLRRGSETETLRPITEIGRDTLRHPDSENDQESHHTETGLESHLHTETGPESRLHTETGLESHLHTEIDSGPLQGEGPGHPMVADHHRLRQVSIEKVWETTATE